jgi:iron(III) transport system substrate-binding protein
MKLFARLAAPFALFGVMAVPGHSQEVPALKEITDSAERARVEALIDSARKEGALEWTGLMILPEHAQEILADFKKYYGLNNLRTEYTYSSSGELITRVEQLLKAKRNNFDVIWTVAWGWYNDLLKRNELMKYDSPRYAEYTLSNEAGMSKSGYWVSDAYTFSPMFNPDALAKHGLEEFAPTSWKDFTNPRLKGLMSVGNVPQSSTTAPTAQGLHKVLGEQWFKDLATNVKPILWTKSAQARDWIGSGEYPIGLMNHAKDALSLRERNVPVRLVYPEEGVVLLPFAPVITASAPHPNAAKLFIDYVRSAHGAQKIMDSGALLFFGRPCVKSPVPDLLPPWEKIKVIPMNWDEEDTPGAIRKVRQMFTGAGIGQ